MRTDYIDWDQYFMGISLMSAMRSKDPHTQVGACIVNEDHKIVGIGYNGFPRGVSDKEFPWEREGDYLDTKYPYVVHAEQNAILNSTTKLEGCRIYVSLFPCHECTKTLIQAGITEVIYVSDKYADTDSIRASKKMLQAAGVAYRQMPPMQLSLQTGNEIFKNENAKG